MIGILFSILAGIFISLQGVFNTRVSDKIGFLETTTVVHGVGFIFALIITLIYGSGSFSKIGEINKIYLLGGVFGVIIVFSVAKGISILGASFSIAIMLVIQLIIATTIDTFGLFGSPQIKFEYTKLVGLFFMIIGIIIFKLKG
ncbi:DMT family transporter [Clostridium sp. CX1]|uniref:DMT family transporter n=1 Tax=Clostridium tanneri TaxID=3037988 RepID=A0ABU4JY62_9CLOT|nr:MULTISPECIES: DMT family transporter [unclassified Clostridium]MCT8978815.1 DMT family transporter [Clostridium sp. CX1]MDW8803113.1 DMT family transporter [Clostridium sp. A1-XYC3]